jgi:NADPH2:quinone reductase
VALKAEIAKALRQRVWPWLEHGAVRPVIDCVMPLSEARAAHELMESGRHMGKIVLSTGRA